MLQLSFEAECAVIGLGLARRLVEKTFSASAWVVHVKSVAAIVDWTSAGPHVVAVFTRLTGVVLRLSGAVAGRSFEAGFARTEPGVMEA